MKRAEIEKIADEMLREAREAEKNGESFDPSWVVGWATVIKERCGE